MDQVVCIVVVVNPILRCNCPAFDPRFRLEGLDGDQVGILFRPFVVVVVLLSWEDLDRILVEEVVHEDHNHHSVRETCYFGKAVPVHHTGVPEVVIFVSVQVLDRTTVEEGGLDPWADVHLLEKGVLPLSLSREACWTDRVPFYHRIDLDLKGVEAVHFDPNFSGRLVVLILFVVGVYFQPC